MQRKFLYVIISVLLLSVGWLGAGGFTLLVALVPLLLISDSYSDSKRDWWRMAGWASLTFALWNVATVWWVWIATPILKYDINSGNYYNASIRDKRCFYEDDEELTYTPIEFTIPTAVVNDPLNVEVSLYKGVSDNIGTTVNLKDFLFTDQYKDIAEAIRSGKTIEERHEIKNRYRTALPCATVCGHFTERKRDKVAEYSGLIESGSTGRCPRY